MGVVYRIINAATDSFYIGATRNPIKRKWQHWDALKKGEHYCIRLQQDWITYGEHAFSFTVDSEVSDNDLVAAENSLLALYVGKPECYNTLARADISPSDHPDVQEKIRQTMIKKYAENPSVHPRIGKKHSEESRKKISEKVQAAVERGGAGKYVRSEDTINRLSASLKGNQNSLGVKRSAEERAAISARMKGSKNFLGKTHSMESRIKMGRRIELTMPDGMVREYPTLTMLRTELGMTPPTADRALKSGAPIVKGKFAGMVLRYVQT